MTRFRRSHVPIRWSPKRTDMTDQVTINGQSTPTRTVINTGLLRRGRFIALLRSLLSGTRLLNRAVRSLSKQTKRVPLSVQSFSSSLLLKPTQALMLAGIRCAGAGGGGPGHCSRDGMSGRQVSICMCYIHLLFAPCTDERTDLRIVSGRRSQDRKRLFSGPSNCSGSLQPR